MTPDLTALRITLEELDQLTGLDIGSVFMGGIIRPSVFRSPRRLLSLLVSECLLLAVGFILCLGLGLVLVRQRQDFDQFGQLLLGVTGVIGMGAIAWHLYQWHRSKTLITLARLLDEVDRHNDIVRALQVMADLATVQPGPVAGVNPPEVMLALQTTRDSLVAALMTEKILRRHRALLDRRQELCRTLEINLATLHALHLHHQADEYHQFLQEAVQIGLAVQNEMKNHG